MARCRWSLMPAKPRPLPDARRERLVRPTDLEERVDRPVEALSARVRAFVARDLLELALDDDFFDPVLLSPFFRRVLFFGLAPLGITASLPSC
jgi:hypothetical protein